MRSMIRASENMATTKKRSLRIMRQKYVNGRNLGINRGNGASFVEKNVRRLKWAGLPLEFWKRSGLVLVLSSIMLMAGSFLYYESRWRGSSEMVTFLVHGIIVCAFLIVVENIFLINNKLEILKANIRDYLENLTLPPPKERISPEDLKEFGNLRGVFTEKTKLQEEGAKEIAAASENNSSVEVVKEKASYEPRSQNIDSDRILDSFLKEYFS
ncbi:MAG: hypothetical protein E7257_04360 [Lachnospiraceae bacterium]|nr:hypothetical protein [Lachnospiraceae bacterium]MBQ9935748.1 hypothetical protein [Lachnospiraceae bacterium]